MERTATLNNQNTKEYKISEKAFRALMVLVWVQYTVLNFISVLLRSVPLIGSVANYAIPIAIIASAVVALPYFTERLKGKDLIFYALLIGVLAVTMIFSKSNGFYVRREFFRMAFEVFPLYFLGVAYSHTSCKKPLFWASLAGVCAYSAYLMYNVMRGVDMATDNMDASYKVLPSILYLIYSVFEYRKLWVIPFVAVGGFLILSYGTRGPLIVMLAYLGYYMVSYVFRKGSFWLKLLAVLMLGFVAYCIFVDNVLSDYAEALIPKFESIGIDTRILELFLDGELVEHDSGRGDLYDVVKAWIWDDPLWGHGVMSDRVFLDDRYVHHLLYEIWCHFGLIFGTLILMFMIGIPLRAIFKTKNVEVRSLIIMLCCAVFLRLLLSNSYLYEGNLFFVLGISISTLRKAARGE